MKQRRTRFSKALQYLDLFKESKTFSVDGDSAVGSNTGALISLLIISFTIFYGFRKFEVMYKRQDSLQQTFIETDAISEQTINFGEQGFNLGAIALGNEKLKYIDPVTKEIVLHEMEDVLSFEALVLRLESDLSFTVLAEP